MPRGNHSWIYTLDSGKGHVRGAPGAFVEFTCLVCGETRWRKASAPTYMTCSRGCREQLTYLHVTVPPSMIAVMDELVKVGLHANRSAVVRAAIEAYIGGRE